MKKFNSFREYERWTNTFENASEYENIPCFIDDGWRMSFDMFTKCKNYKTALRRFEKVFKEACDDIEDWAESMRETCEHGIWSMYQHEEGYPDFFSYGVEETIDDYWYIYLNISGVYANR